MREFMVDFWPAIACGVFFGFWACIYRATRGQMK